LEEELMRKVFSSLLFSSLAASLAIPAGATTLPFWYSTGNTAVVEASYDTATNSLSTTNTISPVAAITDGVLLGPNSTLFVAIETGNGVFQIQQSNGVAVTFQTATAPSFLLSMNQNNAASPLFVANNNGSIATLPITGGVLQPGTIHSVTGVDTNVSQLAWDSSNNVYYVTGGPGTTGNFGHFSVGSFSTTSQIATGITTAQDAIFDSFTGMILLTGEGQYQWYNPTTNSLSGAVDLPGATAGGSCAGGGNQFDVSSVDGAGHALVAGCDNLYYFDFDKTGDVIASAVLADAGVKDPALLPGVPPTVVPEPSMAGLLAFGAGLLAFGRSRRKN
jgi:PEP-CTERM motif